MERNRVARIEAAKKEKEEMERRLREQNERELAELEAEHQRLLAEETAVAEKRMARQREKLEEEQRRLREARMGEAGKLDADEKDRILREFEENRARIDAVVSAERARQAEVMRIRLEKRRYALRSLDAAMATGRLCSVPLCAFEVFLPSRHVIVR